PTTSHMGENDVAIAPDGRTVAIARGRGVQIHDLPSGKVRHTRTSGVSSEGDTTIHYSGDGKRLVGVFHRRNIRQTNGTDGVVVWDVESGQTVFEKRVVAEPADDHV